MSTQCRTKIYPGLNFRPKTVKCCITQYRVVLLLCSYVIVNVMSSFPCLWCLYESDETFTHPHRGSAQQGCVSVRCWRKPQHLETTDKDKGKLGIEPATVLPQGNDATRLCLQGGKHKLLKLKLPPLYLHLKQIFHDS